MASVIRKGESIFIPFNCGHSVLDSQLNPRMYKTKEAYEKYRYRCGDAELAEYAEVVRCENCASSVDEADCPEGRVWCKTMCRYMKKDGYCSFGERRDNETD